MSIKISVALKYVAVICTIVAAYNACSSLFWILRLLQYGSVVTVTALSQQSGDADQKVMTYVLEQVVDSGGRKSEYLSYWPANIPVGSTMSWYYLADTRSAMSDGSFVRAEWYLLYWIPIGWILIFGESVMVIYFFKYGQKRMTIILISFIVLTTTMGMFLSPAAKKTEEIKRLAEWSKVSHVGQPKHAEGQRAK